MSDSAIAARIVDALRDTADRELGKSALVSVNMEMIAPPTDGAPEVSVARKTRTLLFLHADFRSADGTRIASANSVHKVLA